MNYSQDLRQKPKRISHFTNYKNLFNLFSIANNMTIFKNIYFKAFLIWFVPFMFSFAFYDKTGQLVGNFWLFKLTMIFVASFTIYITLRNYFKTHSDWLETAGKVLAVNVILDIVVLHLVLKMPIISWLAQVLPVYIILIPLASYLIAKKQSKIN
jgi:hypothetical protein